MGKSKWSQRLQQWQLVTQGPTRVRSRLLRLLCLGLLLPFLLSGCTRLSPQGVAANAPIRLTLWQGVNPPPNRDVLQSLVTKFNQTHPDIQVESLYVGQPDQQIPKILAAAVGNALPDLLWFNPTITGQLVELDAIRPLDDWLDQSPQRSQLDPALLPTMTYQNQRWSVPFATNNTGIFYRPSLFAAAGITELPTTWQELRQVAQTLTRDTDGDGRIDQHGMMLGLGKGEFTVFTWLPFFWSGGAELTTEPGATQPLDLVQPGAIAALQLWQDLVKSGAAILSQPERGYELDDFIAGKVAMQISGPWTLGQLQQADIDFDVMPIPQQQEPATGLGGENLFICKTGSDRERAAFTFAEYVISEGFQTDWALGTGYLPVNLQSRQSPRYQEFVRSQPTVAVFLDQMSVARSRPLFPGYARVSDNLGRALEATVLQRRTPEAALKEAQQRLNLVFDQN